MTTPLDRDLAERLERLAAAVPVRWGELDPVHAGAVRARQRVRMSWLTPLVALVVLALVGGVIGIGKLNVLNSSISATTKLGDFTLTITSAKARYRTGETVDIKGSLTYNGAAEQIQISHALHGPLGFGIVESVRGFLLSPGWRMSCNPSQLNQGVAIERAFAKSGGYTGPDDGEFERFMQDSTLELPAGTWHPYVVAEFSLGDCRGPSDGEHISMRAELEIDVEDSPQTTAPPITPVPDSTAIHIVNLDSPSVEIEFRNRAVAWLSCGESTVIAANQLESSPPWNFIVRDDDGASIGAALLDWHLPAGILIRDGAVLSGPWPMSYGPAFDACGEEATESPAPTSDPASSPPPNAPQTSGETDGDFEFVLTSDKQVYRPDEPILIEGRLTYTGPEDTILISHPSGLISFRIFEKVFGEIQVGGISDLMCGPTTLVRDEPFSKPFQKSGSLGSGAHTDRNLAWMQDPVLTLPVGTWHITASAGSPCLGPGAEFDVGGQLTIVVSDDPSATPGLPQATD